MEFEDLTIVKGGKQKGSPIFDSIMNGINDFARLGNKALDEAIGTSVDYGSRVIDGAGIRLDRASKDPLGTAKDIGLGALNSFPATVSGIGDMFDVDTPASDSATKFLKSKLADSDSLGFDMAEVVGIGGIAAKPLNKMYGLMDNTASRLADTVTNKKYLGSNIKTTESLQDNFRGYGNDIARDIFENTDNFKKVTSPSYREVARIPGASGVHISASKSTNPNSIYVANKRDEFFYKDGQYIARETNTPRQKMNSTKKHEYNHETWVKKYGEFKHPDVKMTRGTTDDLINDVEWSSKPWEINAQARQIGDYLAILKKDPDNVQAYSAMEDLVKNAAPFVDDFMKQYPDELGDHILRGMDYFDNTVRMPGPI